MIEDAERRGVLTPDSVIIEPTTGNTGIALALVAARKGYPMIVVMPEFVSRERTKICEAFGAKVVLTPKEDGVEGMIQKANELVNSTPNAFMPNQFENPANPDVHRETTGRELVNQTDGYIDAFVCAAGTGGTFTGVSRLLKEEIPNIKIITVEPEGAAILSGGKPGYHQITGIGEGFIPKVLDTSLIDEIIVVSDENAIETKRRLVLEEGILAGISTGANVWASLQVAKTMDKGRIVTIMPDCALRYMSTME
jgi:cysteine synthase A